MNDSRKKHSTLAERLKQCDSSTNIAETDRQWLEIAPVGREFGSPDYEAISRGNPEKLCAISPGEILRTEFLDPLDISAEQISIALNLPVGLVTQILDGTQAMTEDIAARLGHYFKMEPAFWVNLQRIYDDAQK